MRAVIDVNVVVSGLLSPSGAPARVLRGWLEGAYELVVSPTFIDELARTLEYPKLASRITRDEATELTELLRRHAHVSEDPVNPPPIRSRDPGDDYLIALAESTGAMIVSGDADLLDLASQIPVLSPGALLALIESGRPHIG